MSHNKQLNTNYNRKCKQTPERLQKSDSRRYYLKNPKPSKTQQLHKGSTVSHVFFLIDPIGHISTLATKIWPKTWIWAKSSRLSGLWIGDLEIWFQGFPFKAHEFLGDFCILTPTIHGYFMQPNGIAGVGQGAAASKVGLLRLGSRKKWENSSQRSLEIWI